MKITANMVTLTRISLMPLPCIALVYASEPIKWLCFFILVLLGMTDFVDGMLARRDGPTRLGALMDPVADKVFVLAGFFAFSATHAIAAWALALILFREFLITAFRSAVSLRGGQVKTSFWAKIKTDYQMAGLGFIFLMIYLPQIWAFAALFLFFLSFGLVAIVYKYYLSRRIPYWIMPATWGSLYAALLQIVFGAEVAQFGTILIILLATWGSAFEYIKISLGLFRKTGLELFDYVRLSWSFVFAVLIAPLVCFDPKLVLPLLFCLAFEFALIGIDNVVAEEEKIKLIKPFMISGLFGLIFATFAYMKIFGLLGILNFQLWPWAIGLGVISFVNLFVIAKKYAYLFKQAL